MSKTRGFALAVLLLSLFGVKAETLLLYHNGTAKPEYLVTRIDSGAVYETFLCDSVSVRVTNRQCIVTMSNALANITRIENMKMRQGTNSVNQFQVSIEELAMGCPMDTKLIFEGRMMYLRDFKAPVQRPVPAVIIEGDPLKQEKEKTE